MEQFKGLVNKNFILYRRNWLGSFIQFFVPIMFAIFFLIARVAFPATIVPAESYAGLNQYQQTFYPEDIIKQFNLQTIKSCTNNQINSELMRNGVVAIGPENDQLALKLKETFENLGYRILMVKSNQQIDRIVSSINYGKTEAQPSICFSLFVDSSYPQYSFRMRFNISDDISSQGPSTFNPVFSMGQWNYWTAIATSRKSGLFQVNTLILNAILQKQTGNQNLSIIPTLAPIGYKQHYSDQLFNYIKDFIDIFTLLPSIILFLRMTSLMLKQKQKRIRQIMKVMGMSSVSYYAPWIIQYFIIYLISHLFTTLVFYLTLKNMNFSVMFITFILFDLVLIVQSLFIQTFFIESVIGTLTALTFFFIQFIGSFIIKVIQVPSQLQITLASICPFSSFVMIMEELFYSNFSFQTLEWENITSRVYNYRVSIGIVSLIINIIVWSLLTLYFQQVFPNSQGIRKHPLFFLGFSYDEIDMSNLRQSSTIMTLGRRNSVGVAQGIFFDKVWKIFSHNQKVAVKNFTLQIQPNSIFTLLGHNGAGKTTTLSMMAGITNITKGDIYIEGKSIKNIIHDVKKNMGFCPQHNTLYDQLTIIQHLQLFRKFKLNKQQNQKQEILSLLDDLQLSEKKRSYPNDLSGGQKRRLQLALAFIGDSKIIFLDQPTSGLDTYSRRKVWNFIRKKRAGKIIILTTHFMDEAEVLSDRLGIMKDGKLICHGTSSSLKQKYKLGYCLNIQKLSPQIPSQPIVKLIKSILNQSIQIQVQSAVKSQLNIQFPTTNLNNFIQLFEKIQAHKQQLKIRGYGISTSTLQQVLLEVTGNQEQSHKQQQSIKLQSIILDQIKTKNNILQNKPDTQQQFQNQYYDVSNDRVLQVQSDCCLFFKRIWITFTKRMKLTMRNVRLLLLEIIIPCLLVVIIVGVQKGISAQQLPAYSMKLSLYQQYFPITYVIAGNYSNPQFDSFTENLTQITQSSINLGLVNESIYNMSQFDTQILIPRKTKKMLGGILFTSPLITQFDILANTQSVYSPLVTLNTISQSIINVLAAKNVTINPIMDPLPLTKKQLANYYNPATSFMVAIIFSIALSYKYGSLIFQIVKERVLDCKHLQIISGMGLTSFWIGNFIFDFLLYFIFALFSLCMCKVFEISQLIGNNGQFQTSVLVFMLFGISQLLFTYISSFAFKDHNNAQSMFYFFTFMFGAMLPVVVLVFRYIGGILTNISFGLSWVLRIVPAFSFGQAIINLQSISILSQTSQKDYKPMDGDIALYNIYYLGLSIPLFIIILILIEVFTWTNLGQIFRKYKKLKRLDISRMDSIVVREVIKTQNADAGVFPIVLKNVSKVYQCGKQQKVAVNNLNLSIQKGQIFGLLGVNGAGKSTTFKMLTRDILSTSGQIYINGYDIQKQFQKIKVHVGYCPQFCALFENLTVKQQLVLYYKIKGFKQNSINYQVHNKLKMFNIIQYANVYSKDLSGGNQRKLSMAIALIGNPSVVLLDQPSTGVDPYSKRFMWKIINNLNSKKKQTTVILTTHSMEQAEYLSTRVGVMVNGNFECLGQLQRVKNKYSVGFFLQLKLKKVDRHKFQLYLNTLQITKQIQQTTITPSNIDQYLNKYFPSDNPQLATSKQIVKQVFSNSIINLKQLIQRMIYQKQGEQLKHKLKQHLLCKIQDQHDNRDWKFQIKQMQLISKAIIFMQKHKQSLNVQEYHINSTSLEQILNNFSQKHEREKQQAKLMESSTNS